MNLAALAGAPIRTVRLELRPHVAEDAEAIFEAFASDARVTKYMDWEPASHFDASKAAERYAELASDMAAGRRITWVIRVLDEPRLCGKMELRIDGNEGDVGYVLAASHWGRGIVPEALNAVLAFARKNGLRRREAALIRPALSSQPRDSECYEIQLKDRID